MSPLLPLLVLGCQEAKSPSFIHITNEDPSLQAWANRSQRDLDTWWPKIHDLLGVPLPKEPAPIQIVIKTHGNGVAGTGGRYIEVNGDFVRKHPDDVGLIVHELVHVVQAYPRYNPSWLVEGIADYIRWMRYEPVSAWPKVNPDKADFHRGYRDVGAFLDWAQAKYDANLVKKLDKALKLNLYDNQTWVLSTHKSFDDLWAEYLNSLRKRS